VVAAVVVLALIVGGIVVLTSNHGGGGGSSAAGGLKQAWAVPDDHSTGLLTRVWTTSSTVVRITQDTVTGYSLTTGQQEFTLAPPKAGLKPCDASPTVSAAGVGTVFYGTSSASCGTVAAVDAVNGKLLWNVTASSSTSTEVGHTFLDGSVAVAATGTAIAGVDLTSGKDLWDYKPSSGDCSPAGSGGQGAVLVVQEDCTNDSGSWNEYVAVDGATGKHLWEAHEPDGTYLDGVVSTDPVVVYAASAGGGSNNFLAFDSGGHITATIPTTDASIDAEQNYAVPVAVTIGSTLYANTGKSDSTTVTAYSLSSGSKLWSYQDGSESTAVVGVAADGQSPLVVGEGYANGAASTVHRLNATTGSAGTAYSIPSSVDTFDALITTAPNGDVLVAPETAMVDNLITAFSRN
jgi:hypothetical protein